MESCPLGPPGAERRFSSSHIPILQAITPDLGCLWGSVGPCVRVSGPLDCVILATAKVTTGTSVIGPAAATESDFGHNWRRSRGDYRSERIREQRDR